MGLKSPLGHALSKKRLNREPASDDGRAIGAAMSIARFVEERFVPDRVLHKTPAGRAHYQAILRYILTPGSVARLFAPYRSSHVSKPKNRANWPYLDEVSLRDLSADHVRKLISYAMACGYSPQTVKHIRNVLGAIIVHAKKLQAFQGENPISEVQLPPMVRRKFQDLSLAQAKAVMQMLQHPEREVAIITICTGLSVSEICALRWDQFNLTDSMVFTAGKWISPRSVMIHKQEPGLKTPERGVNPIRYIGLTPGLITMLTELHDHQRISDPSSLLIASPKGRSQSLAILRSTHLKSVARELRIPWLTWQLIRRAHQALMLEVKTVLTDELLMSTHGNFTAARREEESNCVIYDDWTSGIGLAGTPGVLAPD